jgi:DNA-directed RNA polymerase subunit RPC12/RpoP
MDWKNITDTIFLWYNEFVEWYLVQPIYGQFLSIIGIIALLALAITLIYYVIKGIAYLIYYILKGIYLLLKGIGLGIFKLCEGFYKLVSGEIKVNKQTENNNTYRENQFNGIQSNLIYCTECGKRFSEKMIRKMQLNGNVFCVNCGKEFNTTQFQISLTH